MIEVELKFSLSQPFDLATLGELTLVGSAQMTDRYLDTTDFGLLRQAVFVRIRDKDKLEFKFNETADSAHVQSSEYSFDLTAEEQAFAEINMLFQRFLPMWKPGKDLNELITNNSLLELATIQKNRTTYTTARDWKICIDQVAGLGEFLELELDCPDDESAAKALEDIEKFGQELDLETVRVGYVELWLSLNNPAAYVLGKYRI